MKINYLRYAFNLHANFLLIIISLIIILQVSTTFGNSIEGTQQSQGQPSTLFSSTLLKNQAVGGSSALKDEGSSASISNSNIRYLREFVSSLLRALKDNLSSKPLSFPSLSSVSPDEKVERRQDSMTTIFRFPEQQSSETGFKPQTHYSSLIYPSSSSSSSSSLTHLSSRSAFEPIERKVRMGKIERVTRPTFGANHQTISTHFNLPSSQSQQLTSSPHSSSSPSASTAGLITASTSYRNLNDTRQIKYGKPSTIQSQPLYVTDGPRDGKRGRSLKTIDVQGVKIIVGERVPDSPEDKIFTWRNARVIKGVLVPNGSTDGQSKSEADRNFQTRSRLL